MRDSVETSGRHNQNIQGAKTCEFWYFRSTVRHSSGAVVATAFFESLTSEFSADLAPSAPIMREKVPDDIREPWFNAAARGDSNEVRRLLETYYFDDAEIASICLSEILNPVAKYGRDLFRFENYTDG